MTWWNLIKEEYRNFEGSIKACIEDAVGDALSPHALPSRLGLFRDNHA